MRFLFREAIFLIKKFLEKAVSLVRDISRMRIGIYAANACFFLVLAVFPLLVLLLSLVRYTGLQVETLTDMLQGILPQALMGSAQRLILSTYRATSGALVSLSALTALWSAGRGIHGLRTGLNAIYGVEENRGYFYTRGVSALYTFAFLLVLILTLMLHVFATTLLQFLPFADMPILRFFLLLGAQTLLFTTLYMVLPNRRNRFADSLPGAMFASAGWLIFSDLFSMYVEHFPNYANIYGSVYAVALSMLWLYFCVSIVFYGGVLNAYLTKHP